MTCSRCGRLLRDPTSIAAGLGSTCRKLLATRAKVRLEQPKGRRLARRRETTTTDATEAQLALFAAKGASSS